MKKVGTLTYHHTRNFGAVLQAYALQKKVQSLNVECDIIDYDCKEISENYKIKTIKEIKSLKEIIKWILTIKDIKESQRKFDEFYKNKYKLSKKRYNRDNISKSNEEYNIFIAGSDQIWNMNLTKGDNTYFLDFVDKKNRKASYAASLGYSRIPDVYIEETKKLTNSFDYIALREEEGQKEISKLNEKKVELVLDPTLLLEKEDWVNICLNNKINEEYILVYIVAPSPTLLEFSRKLARQYKCKIYCVHYLPKKILGVKNLCNLSPEEFLTYIKNAKFIVTSSFHGLALSLELEKEVFYELDTNKYNYNSRIQTLARKLKIEDRQIINGNSIGENKNMDYKKINKLLKIERAKSIEYLKRVIEE